MIGWSMPTPDIQRVRNRSGNKIFRCLHRTLQRFPFRQFSGSAGRKGTARTVCMRRVETGALQSKMTTICK